MKKKQIVSCVYFMKNHFFDARMSELPISGLASLLFVLERKGGEEGKAKTQVGRSRDFPQLGQPISCLFALQQQQRWGVGEKKGRNRTLCLLMQTKENIKGLFVVSQCRYSYSVTHFFSIFPITQNL